MIYVIASVYCKPGQRNAFLGEFRAIVPLVLRENGCLEYGPTIDTETDIESQHRSPDRVTIVEKWTSVPALKAHLAAPHMTDYRSKVAELIESTELRVLEVPA